jgi:O-antigen/teichoic acid export membrane protein
LNSLKNKSFKGLTWGFIDTLAGSGISFVIGIILARLLSPSVFGIVGMVAVIFAIANTVIDSGFSVGLIRKVTCTQEDYSTVFYFNLVISTLLYLILFVSAPFIAVFFREPQLTNITRVLGLVIVIDSLSIVQKVILTRNIDFKSQTIVSLISSILSGIIGIYMAYNEYGVWSLIFQVLTKQLANGFILWLIAKWRPSLVFSITIFKELFSFGSKLLLSGLVNTVQSNIYYLVIGRYFTSVGLGYYTRAESFNAIVTNNLTGTLEKVFFPVLSSIQTDDIRLKSSFKKVIRSSFFISFLALITLAVIAKPFIYILIGPKWDASVLLLQLICLSSIFLPLNSVNLNILKIKGKSNLILRLQIIKSVLLVFTVVAGIFFGINWLLIVRIVTTFLAYWINSWYSGKLIDYNMSEQLKDIAPYFWAIAIIAICMFSFSFLPINNYLMIGGQLSVGALLFFIIFEKKRFEEYLEIKGMIKGVLKIV